MEHDSLTRWSGHMEVCHIPRWKELPDIDLYMDQVVALVEKHMRHIRRDAGEKALTPSMINNYVKQGVIPPPVRKKYSRAHIARLIVICLLKDVLSISEIRDLYFGPLPEGLIGAAYDEFCAGQESAFLQVSKRIRNELSDAPGGPDGSHRGIALNLVALVSAGKATIQKILRETPEQAK